MSSKSVCLAWHKQTQTSRAHSFIIYELLIWTPFAVFFFFLAFTFCKFFWLSTAMTRRWSHRFEWNLRWMEVSRLNISDERQKKNIVFIRCFFFVIHRDCTQSMMSTCEWRRIIRIDVSWVNRKSYFHWCANAMPQKL